ncbi:hypothetical protein MRX96_003371 [Rhipicephalus microplus]
MCASIVGTSICLDFPIHDKKIILRPHRGLCLDRWTHPELAGALWCAAGLTTKDRDDIIFRLRPLQNIAIISTPQSHVADVLYRVWELSFSERVYPITTYFAAPDNSCKGIVTGIVPGITVSIGDSRSFPIYTTTLQEGFAKQTFWQGGTCFLRAAAGPGTERNQCGSSGGSTATKSSLNPYANPTVDPTQNVVLGTSNKTGAEDVLSTFESRATIRSKFCDINKMFENLQLGLALFDLECEDWKFKCPEAHRWHAWDVQIWERTSVSVPTVGEERAEAHQPRTHLLQMIEILGDYYKIHEYFHKPYDHNYYDDHYHFYHDYQYQHYDDR